MTTFSFCGGENFHYLKFVNMIVESLGHPRYKYRFHLHQSFNLRTERVAKPKKVLITCFLFFLQKYFLPKPPYPQHFLQSSRNSHPILNLSELFGFLLYCKHSKCSWRAVVRRVLLFSFFNTALSEATSNHTLFYCGPPQKNNTIKLAGVFHDLYCFFPQTPQLEQGLCCK